MLCNEGFGAQRRSTGLGVCHASFGIRSQSCTQSERPLQLAKTVKCIGGIASREHILFACTQLLPSELSRLRDTQSTEPSCILQQRGCILDFPE